MHIAISIRLAFLLDVDVAAVEHLLLTNAFQRTVEGLGSVGVFTEMRIYFKKLLLMKFFI